MLPITYHVVAMFDGELYHEGHMVATRAYRIYGQYNSVQIESETRFILGLCPVNERRRYCVTMSLIDWVQT